MSSQWCGKVVLITGASSGLGKAIAFEFAKLHCKLAIHGRDLPRLQEVEKQCVELGCKKDEVLKIQGDVLVEDDINAIVDKTIEKFGSLDILVSNAGKAISRLVAEVTSDEINEMYGMHCRAPTLLVKRAAPHLKKSRGVVVLMSSVTGTLAGATGSVYCTAKAATDMLAKVLALELAPEVRVNAICPGLIETPLLDTLTPRLPADHVPAFMQSIGPLHPSGKCGTMEEVAQVVRWLASDDSAIIRGQCIIADNGACLRHPIFDLFNPALQQQQPQQ